MSFGVTETGFVRKTLAEIKADLEAGWRLIFGSNTDLTPSTPDAQIIGLLAGSLDEAWQAAAGVYSSMRPSQAAGQSLSDIVQFNGITRQDGTSSTVVATVTTTGSITLTTAHRFATGSGAQFRPFAGGIYANNDTVLMIAVEIGPIPVGVGDLTQIVTPVANLTSITNVASNFSTGTLDESDSDLRARQAVSTENSAINILEALYASLAQISGVTSVRIYVNSTAATVGGRPAKSYEVVIQGGANATIATTIWQNHPAGIEVYGTTTQNIIDSQGNTQAMKFTRPSSMMIYVDVTKSPTADYPATGDDDIKQAIVDYAEGRLIPGLGFGIGDDVFASLLYTPINSVAGHHVTALLVDDVNPPVSAADIAIGETQIAAFATSRVRVF